MKQDLFRREALDAQCDKSCGEALLVRPFSFWMISATVVCLVAVMIGFSSVAEYTRKAHVQGYLAPSQGLVKVYAPETGTVVEKLVVEGQRVSRGDKLYVLSTERSSSGAGEARAAAIAKLAERRASLVGELAKHAEIARIDAQSLTQHIRAMDAEVAQIGREIITREQRVAGAERTLGRHAELAAAKFISEAQWQQKQEELLDQQAKLQAIQRSRMTQQREREQLRAELVASDLKTRNEAAAIERGIATLEQELAEQEARRSVVIVAPADGVASAVLAERGQTVTPHAPMLSILPAGAALQADLFVPSRAAGFVAVGQTVALRYQAFPYQRFGSYGARITGIARTPVLPGEANLPVVLNEPAYRVTATIDAQHVQAYGQAVALQAGMLLEADIMLDHRRLYEWVLDPLFAVSGRV